MFEILALVQDGASWKDAFLRVLPQRKHVTAAADGVSVGDSTTTNGDGSCSASNVNGGATDGDGDGDGDGGDNGGDGSQPGATETAGQAPAGLQSYI